jgi:hypothetical protein
MSIRFGRLPGLIFRRVAQSPPDGRGAWRSFSSFGGGANNGEVCQAPDHRGTPGEVAAPRQREALGSREAIARASQASSNRSKNCPIDRGRVHGAVFRSEWELLAYAAGMHASMRFIHDAAAVGIAIAVPFIAPVALMEASSAHADADGYLRCVGNIRNLPLAAPNPNSPYLAGIIEQDLKSGVSPAAESQKVAQMGFEPRVADAIVHCVVQNYP